MLGDEDIQGSFVEFLGLNHEHDLLGVLKQPDPTAHYCACPARPCIAALRPLRRRRQPSPSTLWSCWTGTRRLPARYCSAPSTCSRGSTMR